MTLYFVKSFFEDGSVFELVWDFISKVGKIVCSERSLNLVLFFTMVLEKCRIKLFIDDVAVFGRDKIDI